MEHCQSYSYEKNKGTCVILIDCDSDDEDEDGKDDGNHRKSVFKLLKVCAPQIGCQCYVQPRQHPQSSSGRRKPFVEKMLINSIIILDHVIG